ncbi:ABC transporter ATP-binding protein [Rossellomorea marisflavi]|uniref:ABC transporter ATP-binding protein n=1 Tax=Rossellomorea marisflavi TaxID=189381 RepID=A0A5D4RWN4_9BACI|nr:ABC transporter ATP-binding protein [Rossellomorea marisflavi]MDW4526318.1 ABC transporter ATP-binding protein [Rossellomorea marisflavi]TYS54042.1 ABC transporter ATP-binding protein [Rossellomorea marisflavi]WJV17288.1 ABC transporter ATP-binding protein [Rossellomorea marisflavi]
MDTFKKLKDFYWPYKSQFLISMIFLIFVTGITVVYPIILQITIDDVILKGDYQWIPYLAFGFIGIMALKGIGTFIQQYFGDLFGITSVYRLRNELYQKLQFLPFSYYDNAKTGDLMSRLTADVEAFRFFLSFGFSELLRFFLLVSVSFCVMFYYSPSLTFVTLATLPFLAVSVFKFDKAVHPAFRGIRKSFGKLNTNVQENISGINTVKSLSREEFQNGKFNRSNGDYKDKYLFTSDIWAKYFPLMEFLGNVSVILLLGYGGYLVMNGNLAPGELVAFYSLVWYIIWPIMNLGFTINQFSQSKASGERLLEILEVDEKIKDGVHAVEATRMKGEVRFEDVSFHYNDLDEDAALESITFNAPPGRIVGLIGGTGSGKSSVIQLLTRFYEPQEGRITIDGMDIRDYSIKSLRQNIGVVLQESFLFSSTIRSNIAYGRPEASQEDVEKAAKLAQAHDFIMTLPDGYETKLGERGLGLSGGQKQRIAIARAICLDPSILVLDDATSAVDMETEFRIQKALKNVMSDRTTFIIAHRISSLKHADEILVLENGRVAERGRHEDLLANNGPYQRIYDIQYKDQKKILQAGR